ncbi:unnamed protein product [Orchesella dallaii]|uniref:Uncharacterized protein n=1 Tax=Orchesella dallaii TaxID=48710 RepID=A0ABP1RT10_9HEXA
MHSPITAESDQNKTTVLAHCYRDQYEFSHCYGYQSDKCVCRFDEFIYCCDSESYAYCACCPYWFDTRFECAKVCTPLEMYRRNEWSEFAKKYSGYNPAAIEGLSAP